MSKQLASRAWFNYMLLATGIVCISWSAILVKIAGISGFGSGFYRLLLFHFGCIIVSLCATGMVSESRSSVVFFLRSI
ncbi:MAG: hypothetical protein LWW91_10585 [Bacteroidales bacterium]|nr:hypothetical protein [Bacteroidales bacterium]